MSKAVVLERNVFLENCANVIAEQFGFKDDEEVKKILADCLPVDFKMTDELIANVDINSSSFDFTTAINSIKNIFKPNFVQALMWMEPDRALDLFNKEKKADILKAEFFFNLTYPSILLFSSNDIKQEAERYLVFLNKYKHQFIKNGFFTEAFSGSFWLPSFLTGSLEEMSARSQQRILYLEERQKNLIDPEEAHKKWHTCMPVNYDDSFKSSLIFSFEDRKKLAQYANQDWFIEEETLLREKIFSVFCKATEIIVNSNSGDDLVEKYLRLVERTFTIPEFKLLLGENARYFSFPIPDTVKLKFEYRKNFIFSTVQFLSFYVEQEKRTNPLSKMERQSEALLPRDAVNVNLYEAVRITKGFNSLKNLITEFKSIENDVKKVNIRSKQSFDKLRGLVSPQHESKSLNRTERIIPVVERFNVDDDRPTGPCFSEDFAVFYPKSLKQEPLYFSPLQSKVVEFMMREGATKPSQAVTKLQILNEVYNKKFAKIILGGDYEDLDLSEEKLLEEFRKYRLDAYIFSDSPAWKLRFILSEDRDLNGMAKYWLDLDFSKAKAAKFRKKKKTLMRKRKNSKI